MSGNQTNEMSRVPVSGAPRSHPSHSHPLGTGVGASSGALTGAAIGSLFGPIGTLIGGAVGAIGGGVAGHAVAERVDPTGEDEYWRYHYLSRPYYRPTYEYDTDYAPAYTYGSDARTRYVGRQWDDSLDHDLGQGWDKAKRKSRLTWHEAKDAARDAWDRDDRTYRTYEATDRYYADRYAATDRDPKYTYEADYRAAYRYGTHARGAYFGHEWDDELEAELKRGWNNAKGASRLGWSEARAAVKDAWHGLERGMPGDADYDGR